VELFLDRKNNSSSRKTLDTRQITNGIATSRVSLPDLRIGSSITTSAPFGVFSKSGVFAGTILGKSIQLRRPVSYHCFSEGASGVAPHSEPGAVLVTK
jgi:hypothetical protein